MWLLPVSYNAVESLEIYEFGHFEFSLKTLTCAICLYLTSMTYIFITRSSTNTHIVAAVVQKLNSIERPGKQIIITGIRIITQLQLHKVKYKCASFEPQQVIYYWIRGL